MSDFLLLAATILKVYLFRCVPNELFYITKPSDNLDSVVLSFFLEFLLKL